MHEADGDAGQGESQQDALELGVAAPEVHDGQSRPRWPRTRRNEMATRRSARRSSTIVSPVPSASWVHAGSRFAHPALADPAQEDHQPGQRQQGQPALGDGAEVPQGPPAPVADVVQVADVGDHRGQLLIGQGGLAEGRHLPGSQPDRGGDLRRRGRVQRRGVDVEKGAAVTRPGVAGGALESEELAALGQVALAEPRNVRTAAAGEPVHVVGEGGDGQGRVGRQVALDRLGGITQAPVGKRLERVTGLGGPPHRGDRHAAGRQLVVERRPPHADERRSSVRPPPVVAVADGAVGQVQPAGGVPLGDGLGRRRLAAPKRHGGGGEKEQSEERGAMGDVIDRARGCPNCLEPS